MHYVGSCLILVRFGVGYSNHSLQLIPRSTTVVFDAQEVSMADNYSFGMEEEYFVIDAETKSIRRKASPAFLSALKRAIGPAVTREMLQ